MLAVMRQRWLFHAHSGTNSSERPGTCNRDETCRANVGTAGTEWMTEATSNVLHDEVYAVVTGPLVQARCARYRASLNLAIWRLAIWPTRQQCHSPRCSTLSCQHPQVLQHMPTAASRRLAHSSGSVCTALTIHIKARMKIIIWYCVLYRSVRETYTCSSDRGRQSWHSRLPWRARQTKRQRPPVWTWFAQEPSVGEWYGPTDEDQAVINNKRINNSK